LLQQKNIYKQRNNQETDTNQSTCEIT
jgi:hypothetical protein